MSEEITQLNERVRLLELEVKGLCPYCEQRVASYKAPTGCFAPEAWATLREFGIDPANGHKFSCKRPT